MRRVIRNAEFLVDDWNAGIVTGADHHHRAWIRCNDMDQIGILFLEKRTTLSIEPTGHTGDYSLRTIANELLRRGKYIKDLVSNPTASAH
jgi:hypothetical protein